MLPMPPSVLTPRLSQALDFAVIVHAGQVRKSTSIPYVAHLLGVCSLVLEHGGNEDQAIAGLLHDALEDGGAGQEPQIRARFGDAVAEMVIACSDGTVESKADEKLGDPIAAWKQRKQNYLTHLAQRASHEPALLVSACDKLHNARAILSDMQRDGDAVFARFTGRREGTLWYYAQIGEIFDRHASPVAPELQRTILAMQKLTESAAS